MWHAMRWFVALLVAVLSIVAPQAVASAQEGNVAQTEVETPGDDNGLALVTGTFEPNSWMNSGDVRILLEDQAGFIDRDRSFVFPEADQVFATMVPNAEGTSYTWNLYLPASPPGSLRDVSNNHQKDTGVKVYAVAVWPDTFGNASLEERDFQGVRAGWSSIYVTTLVADDGEVVGGKLIVWSPDSKQGFPVAFGPDGRLFTKDDPWRQLHAGYTLVDLDTIPFTFSRTPTAELEFLYGLADPERDFSAMGYGEAFDAMLAQLQRDYVFGQEKGIDWAALAAQFGPRFAEAEANKDVAAYLRALRDFTWAIPDRVMALDYAAVTAAKVEDDLAPTTAAGVGLGLRTLDDGRTIASYLAPDGPAAQAGIVLGDEIVSWQGQPIDDYVASIVPPTGPFATEHPYHLQQLRYATRMPLDSTVKVGVKHAAGGQEETVSLNAVDEDASLTSTSFWAGMTGAEMPVEFKILDNGLGYVRLTGANSVDNRLAIGQWEYVMNILNAWKVPGVIIDARQQSVGDFAIADHMAAYFFDEPLELRRWERIDPDSGKPAADAAMTPVRFVLPGERLRYTGPVAVITGPACWYACEIFVHDMTRNDRAAVIGYYPTVGSLSGTEYYQLPEGVQLNIPIQRAVDPEGKLLIEGAGVAPTVRVPVTAETVLAKEDVLLETAAALLTDKDLPYGAVRQD